MGAKPFRYIIEPVSSRHAINTPGRLAAPRSQCCDYIFAKHISLGQAPICSRLPQAARAARAPARFGLYQLGCWPALAGHRQRSALHSVAGRWSLLAEWKCEMTAGSASIHSGSSAEDGACGIEAHVMLGQPSVEDIVRANLPTRRSLQEKPSLTVGAQSNLTPQD